MQEMCYVYGANLYDTIERLMQGMVTIDSLYQPFCLQEQEEL